MSVCNQNEVSNKSKRIAGKRKGIGSGGEDIKTMDDIEYCEVIDNTNSPNFVPSNHLSTEEDSPVSSDKRENPSIAVSEFRGVDVVKECQDQYYQLLWQSVLSKISQTPVDYISSIEGEINVIVAEMKRVANSTNIEHLEALFLQLFDRAQRYNSSRSLVGGMMTKDEYFGSLSSAKEQLENIKANKEAAATRLNSLDAELKNIEKKLKDLEQWRINVEKQKQQVQSSMQKDREEVEKMQAEELSKEEEISEIETTPFQSDEILQNLAEARGILEASRQNLIHYNFIV